MSPRFFIYDLFMNNLLRGTTCLVFEGFLNLTSRLKGVIHDHVLLFTGESRCSKYHLYQGVAISVSFLARSHYLMTARIVYSVKSLSDHRCFALSYSYNFGTTFRSNMFRVARKGGYPSIDLAFVYISA